MSNLFLSVIATIFWSIVISGVLYFGRRKGVFQKYFGAASLSILYLVCVIRMCLPFDFGFQKGIGVKGSFSAFYKMIALKTYNFSGLEFTILDILALVWISVAIGLFLRYFFQYRGIVQRIKTFPINHSSECRDAMERIYQNTGKKVWVEIRKSNEIQVPLGIGLFQKKIILPEREYTQEELYYILLHEYTHFLKKDLWIKCLSQICCCFIWWNPLSYLLEKELSQVLEIRCDLSVTAAMTSKESASYLATIVNSLKHAGKQTKFISYSASALVGTNCEDELIERFRLVSQHYPAWSVKRKNLVVMTVLSAALIILSYSFTVTPEYAPPKSDIYSEEGVVEITPENAYLRKKDNGKYFLVSKGVEEEIPEEHVKILIEEGFEVR